MSTAATVNVIEEQFSDEELRHSAAEAAAELGEIVARRGLEYLLDAPAPGTEPARDNFARLAAEYDIVAEEAPRAFKPHCHYGKLFIICGMFEHAAVALERAVRLNPDSADARCLYGRALASLGRLEEARVHYDRACALDDRLVEAHFERVIVESRIRGRDELGKTAILN